MAGGIRLHFRGPLNKHSLYKEVAISPSISPASRPSASAKAQESSIAALVKEIAQTYTWPFRVEEIARDVMKSIGISSPSAIKDDVKLWKKRVSNVLGRLVKSKQEELVRKKNGFYHWASALQGKCQATPVEASATLGTSHIDAETQKARWLAIREANRMRPPEDLGDPLPIRFPLELEQEVRVYPKNIIVGGGVTNSGKTVLAMETARLNMERFPITYINSEMSEEELAERLHLFEQAHGIPWRAFYNKVYFAYCACNALQPKDMARLTSLLDPNGINIVDYITINDKFYMIGNCLEQIHAKLNQGIAIVFFQKDKEVNHLLGKSFAEHLARVVMMIDIDEPTQLRCLQFTKVKAPAQKGDKPERRQIWFSEEGGVRLERKPKPAKNPRKAQDPK